jgi:hypothetical protein
LIPGDRSPEFVGQSHGCFTHGDLSGVCSVVSSQVQKKKESRGPFLMSDEVTSLEMSRQIDARRALRGH